MLRGFRNIWSAILHHEMTRHRPIRSMFRVLCWQVRRRFNPRPKVIPFVNNSRFLIFPKRSGSTSVLYYHLPDLEDMIFALHLIRPGDGFVDGGANVGVWTVLMASAGAAVTAIEPIGSAYQLLLQQIQANAFPITPRPVQCAISSKSGTLRMSDDNDTGNQVVADGGTTVPANTLDDITKDGRPTLIKLDLEGHELDALQGAEAVLQSPNLLALVVETFRYHNRLFENLRQLEALLNRHGFIACSYDPHTRLLSVLPGLDQPQESMCNNTIYVRDPASVQARLKSAPTVEYRGHRW